MTRVLSDGEAVDVVLSEREYQKVFAPPIHSKADLLLLMEHYLLRARTDLLCPQMEAGAEGSSIRKVGALALRFISEHGAPMRVRKPGEARSPKLPNDPPASSDTKSMAALRGLLELYDRETCTHDDVKRGGSIWTICNQCDRKWADDRDGGFKPYTDPPPVMLARDLVYGAQRAKADEACDRAADRVAASEEDELRRALADVVTQIRAGRVNIVCAGGIHTQGAGGSKSLGRVDDHEVWQRAIRLSGLDA